MPTLTISIHDTDNLGDQVCNPADYFDLGEGVQRWDAWDVGWADDQESNLVIGGGGLVHGVLASCLGYAKRTPKRKLIAWGLGHNVHGQRHIDYGDALNGFDLVGIRDNNVHPERGWEFVPCPSCMHKAFDWTAAEWREFAEAARNKNPYVVYAHHERPIMLNRQATPIAYWTNALPKDKFHTVLAFLACAETVITNTYHGAYWAMLLGRKVLLYEPFSSRFHGFKHQPPFVNADTWRFTEPLAAPEGYLEECRAANVAFHAKVRAVLGLATPNDTKLAVKQESEVG